jgi:hypothetical protein
VPGDDAVTEDPLVGQAELRRAMGDEGVELDERTVIEEQLESLARGQLSRGVLSLDPIRPATEP